METGSIQHDVTHSNCKKTAKRTNVPETRTQWTHEFQRNGATKISQHKIG